jgi:hypothetical protein
MRKIILILNSIFIFSAIAFSQESIFDFDEKGGKILNNNELSLPKVNNEKFFCKKTPFTINENGEIIELKKEKDIYFYKPNQIIGWRIYCGSSNPWAIKETYSRNVSIAGHNHNGNIPLLRVSDVSLTPNQPPLTSFKEVPNVFYLPFSGSLQGKTTYYYWEYPGEFSHILYETTEWIGGCTGSQTDKINIMIKGLEDLKEDEGYILTGMTSIHPYNHYVTSSFGETLKEIGKEWKQICPQSKPLEYNDASLPWGGLFDIKGNWQPPHRGHRYGVEIDISKRRIRKGNREKVIRMMCKYAIVYSEGDGPNEVPHYHLVSKNAPQEVFKELEEMIKQEKIIPCCPASSTDTIPAACINLESGGQPIPEDNDVPVETDCPGPYTPIPSINFSPGWIEENEH